MLSGRKNQYMQAVFQMQTHTGLKWYCYTYMVATLSYLQQ